MAEKTIHFKIITPEKIVYEDDVDAIYAQGQEGGFGVLPNHVPFMSSLAIDTAKIEKDGEVKYFSIIGGAFQFKDNEAIILTEIAECGNDIDTTRAQLAKERAEAKIASAETQRDIKIANTALARAMARLKAASKQ
ncbi:TPA: ATP synthase F1 subunit epsilon [Candidatus Avigastranaerophilus faecigallinarum]|nr:ATP synthase F1 subunit epsilon [Candidatus Avigastranaerophilus faecigallinarum]